MPRLIAIGVVAGVFSSLFGVGGGLVIVPLLLFAGFHVHAATATSIAAILLTASAATILYALRGEVRPGYALLVGIPAALGAVAGTRAKQELTGPVLTLAFSGLLAAVAGWLLLG